MTGPDDSPRSRHRATRGALALVLVFAPALTGVVRGDAVGARDLTFTHGISYFGNLSLPPEFEHFEWADPAAPKGGSIRLSDFGRFDTFNDLLEKGRAPQGIANFGDGNILYDRLLQEDANSPWQRYGRLARSVAVSDDLATVAFRLRPEARFHDGVPITAHDVKFTFDMIKVHGGPTLRTIFRDVERAEVGSEHEIVFTIAPGRARNMNLAFFIGQIYALPRHYWADREFGRTTVEPPLGSGPYRIAETRDGSFIAYERVPDYWGRDLAVNRGRYNFDRISYDYFLDKHVQKESLKADIFDLLHEDTANDWANNYNVVEVERGLIVKEILALKQPSGFPVSTMWNLRRPMFQDIRVREALWLLRDFEWSNRVLYHDFYRRADSYFTNTGFGHDGGLPTTAELALLEPFREQLPRRVFTTPYRMSKTDGVGVPRDKLARAHELLTAAGWVLRDGKRVHEETGDWMTIQFVHPADNLERVGMPFLNMIERLGIRGKSRTVEPSNYVSQLRRRTFDATILGFTGSFTPGAELRSRFGSAAADIDSSQNHMGIKDPVVDALVERVINAKTRAEMEAAMGALDRVMLWNFYGIAGFYAPGVRYIYWNRFSRPDRLGIHRSGFPETWWWDEEKADLVRVQKGELDPNP